MKLRCMVGLVAAVSVLSVNAKVALAACESMDRVAPVAGIVGGHVAGHDHGSSGEAPTPEQSEAPDDSPPPIACCQAMTSCGTVIDLGRAVEAASSGTTAEIAIGAVAETPMSRITAPEPPPPKA